MALVDCTDTDRKEGAKLVDWAGQRNCPDTHAAGFDAEMSDYEDSLIPVGTLCTCTVISTPNLPTTGSASDQMHTSQFGQQTTYYVYVVTAGSPTRPVAFLGTRSRLINQPGAGQTRSGTQAGRR